MLKKIGYVLEQLYSPLVVHTTDAYKELLDIDTRCITWQLSQVCIFSYKLERIHTVTNRTPAYRQRKMLSTSQMLQFKIVMTKNIEEDRLKSRGKDCIYWGLTCIVLALIVGVIGNLVELVKKGTKTTIVTQLNQLSKEQNKENGSESLCGKLTEAAYKLQYLRSPEKPMAKVAKWDWNDPQDRRYLMNEHLKGLRIHEDKNAPFGVYVPIDFHDALKELDYMLPPEAKSDIKNCTIGDMLSYHHGFGTWIRNSWCLWRGGALADDMKRLGFTHPDDMSGAIFDSYWLKVHGKPIEIKAQSEKYRKYWKMVDQMTNEGSSKGTDRED